MSDLPDHLSLTSLREQAKSPHSCFRNDDADALALVCEHHPKPDSFSSLGDAQRLVAIQYGYRGWSELFEAVETALDEASLLEQRADLFCERSFKGHTPALDVA